jgi:predicted dehydrogenase
MKREGEDRLVARDGGALDCKGGAMHRIALYGLEGHEGIIFEGAAARGDAIVGVASENAAALEAVKGNRGVTGETRFYADWREMLRKAKPDVLAVCSENDRHVEPIVAAAKRGIHVITEKPIAVDGKGLKRIRAAVEKSGIVFSVLFDMRTAPAYIAMREAVRAGAIGKPVLIFAQKSYRLGERPEWMKSRASLGGIIPYIGCHMLDLAMWITGLDVRRVAAFHGNAGRLEVREMEDHAAVAFEMTGGAAMSLTLDYLRPAAAPTHGDARLRIAGSEGVIEVKDLESRVELITAGEGPRDLEIGKGYNLFSDFLDAIDGKKKHVIEAAEIFRVTEILLAALKAADTGKVVEV